MNTLIFDELERNASVVQQLLTGVREVAYRWRPTNDKWNLLDVICHLYDEEREDFRARVASILEDPSKPLTPIDPASWPEHRHYQKQDFGQRILDFTEERNRSVKWLRSLKAAKWDNAYQHPKVGPVTAQLILHNWLAHDLLHVRQIIHIKYLYLNAHASVPLDYAGEW